MPANGAGSPTGGKSVREFFNERRRLEKTGVPIPNIDHHYKKAKGYASPGGWSSRTGSGNSATKGSHLLHGEKKSSAGRDRGQPLAPIQRRPSLATDTMPPSSGNLGDTYTLSSKDSRFAAAGGQARSGIPLRQQNQQPTGGGREGEENPFNARPRLLKHRPLPPTANGHGAGDGAAGIDALRARQGKPPAQPSSLPRYNPPSNRHPNPPQAQPQQQQQPPPPQQLTQQQIQQQYQTQRQQQQQQQQQHRQPHPPPGTKQGIPRTIGKTRTVATKLSPAVNGHGGHDTATGERSGSGKLTDFQKWQLEQDKSREQRLKKLNQDKPVADSNDGYWGQPDDDDEGGDGDDENVDESEDNKENGPHRAPAINGRVTNKDRLSRLNVQRRAMEEEEDDEEEEEEEEGDDYEADIPEEDEDADDDDDEEDPVKAQERALLEQIAAKQREVENLKKEREREEEEEKREMALRKKQAAAERARQKKLDEERRKEEERQRKQEEEEEKEDRKREEQRQKEEEKRRKEDEKQQRVDDRRRQEEEKKSARRQAEEEKRQARLHKQQQQQMSARRATSTPDDDDDDDDHSPVRSRHHNPPDTSRSEQDLDEKPVKPAGSAAQLYMQAAASSEAKGSVGSLVPCRQCGRKFAQERIKKHQDACVKANKPRKEFNAAMKRVEGTDMAKYAGRNRKPDPPKKKSNWRSKHEQFIESLRYAKKVTAYEKEGGDLKDLAPPPPSSNPDFVACPHCGRTFNESAAERHIPRCQTLKTRPPPVNTRKR